MTDAGGEQATVSTTVVVAAMVPFSLSVSASSTTPAIGVPVIFTGVPASGVTVESYAWSFGDGSVATTTGAVASHAYASPGNKVVTVTATSSDGATGTG